MHKNDINFNGNRSNVKIAVLTNDEGNGIAILGNPENISVELNNHRIVVSHNVLLSGVGNKKSMPEKIVWAKDVPEIKGELEIIPLRKKHWPEILKKLFGEPGNSPVPFNPFYYSYDTTK
jgi:beta-galactosidase